MFWHNRTDRSGNRNQNRNRRRPGLEMLEGRQLLSLGAEFATPINTATHNADFDAVNASSLSGAEVVVWTHQDSTVFGRPFFDIRAQRLNNGKLVGPEILVSTGVANAPASVAINNQGDFVVAFTQIASNGNTDILAQAFNSSGNAIGGIVPVATGTFAQTQPSVAIDAASDFVVSYTRNTNNNNPDIFAKLYNANEQLLTVVSVATTSAAETNSSVAMAPDGRFDVAFESVIGKGAHDVILNQYNAQGGLTASRTIDANIVDSLNPSVSVDNSGNAVVAWQQNTVSGDSSDILARRVSSSGVLGPVLTIAAPGDSSHTLEQNPSVALKRDGSGAFVVAYENNAPIFLVARGAKAITPAASAIPPGLSVEVSEVSTFNQITNFNAGPDLGPAVSINNSGQYLLTYTKLTTPDNQNITGRLGQLLPPTTGINQ